MSINMKRIVFIVLCLLGFMPFSMRAQIAVGSWREHLAYASANHVVQAGSQIWVAGQGSLYCYDQEEGTVTSLSKINGLNDVGIKTINYDSHTKILVVAYSNSNIDLLKDGCVVNISDIKRNNIGGDKSINSISFYNRCAYLACGFGIVVVDLERNEIKETYYLGDNGTYKNINDIVFTDSLIVAATDDGIMYADKRSRFLNIATNWSIDQTSLLAGGKVSKLAIDDSNRLVAMVPDDSATALFAETDGMTFVPWLEGDINNMVFSGGRYLVFHPKSLEIYGADRQREDSLATASWWLTMELNDAIISSDGLLWGAHDWASLVAIDVETKEVVHNILPNSPSTSNVFRLTAFDKELFVSPGGHNSTYGGSFLQPEVYIFSEVDQTWRKTSDEEGLLAGTYDIIDVAVNPRNKREKLAAVWGYGIAEISDNKITNLYNADNTDGVLTPYSDGSFTSLRTGGVAFDNKGNAWVTNSLTNNVLVVRKSDGTWQSFDTRGMTGGGDIVHIIWDSINDLKLFWGHANRIYVHDGRSRMAYIDPNNGSKLQTSSLSTVVQDHSGNLWIGTNKGIKVVYNLSNAFANGGAGEMSPVTCNNILFNANGITEYLMAYESITSIAVDGANRKWVGTASGGLYLLSANGQEELAHFTAATSPLFSDKILALAVMPWSGELFIGTDKGVQSYRSNATYAFAEPQDDIHAFPNPVRPDYEGVISIKGFTRNAIVHITDAAGHTVYSTRANGGQATWNGCTLSGDRVASGVYYVFASASDGSMKSVTKILIIR